MQTIGMTCHKKAYTGETNLFHGCEKKLDLFTLIGRTGTRAKKNISGKEKSRKCG